MIERIVEKWCFMHVKAVASHETIQNINQQHVSLQFVFAACGFW